MTEGVRDHIVENYLSEFCNSNRACTQLPDYQEEALLEEINDAYGTYYNFEDSVVVTDCKAADGGICVINGYTEIGGQYDNYGQDISMIKVDLFALDGRRAILNMHEESFDNMCGSMYFYNGRTHEHLRLGDDADKIAGIKEFLRIENSSQNDGSSVSMLHMILPLIMFLIRV